MLRRVRAGDPPRSSTPWAPGVSQVAEQARPWRVPHGELDSDALSLPGTRDLGTLRAQPGRWRGNARPEEVQRPRGPDGRVGRSRVGASGGQTTVEYPMAPCCSRRTSPPRHAGFRRTARGGLLQRPVVGFGGAVTSWIGGVETKLTSVGQTPWAAWSPPGARSGSRRRRGASLAARRGLRDSKEGILGAEGTDLARRLPSGGLVSGTSRGGPSSRSLRAVAGKQELSGSTVGHGDSERRGCAVGDRSGYTYAATRVGAATQAARECDAISNDKRGPQTRRRRSASIVPVGAGQSECVYRPHGTMRAPSGP